jgi:chromosome segregation ATPase
VTIRAMVTLCAVGLTTLTLTACGNPDALSEDQADEIQAARDEAAEANAQVAELTETIEELERRIERADGAAALRSRQLGKRLDGISERLNERAADLRAAIEDAASSSAAAASEASATAGQVGGIVQDLNVLRARYDVHLRRFHGGG